MSSASGEGCDPELYLKRHHVMTYIEDAVTFLLERKEEDPKTKPYELLAEYFESVTKGTHVLFRSYAFVSLTPHNRASFVRLFWHTFAEVAERGDSMRVMEYLSLLRLLCHDFPSALVRGVARVVFSYDALEHLVAFPNFLYTFQVLFYYELFLKRCELVCAELVCGQPNLDLLQGGSTMVVSLPSTRGGGGGGGGGGGEEGSRPETASSARSVEDISASDVAGGGGEGPPPDRLLDSGLFLKAVTSVCVRIREKEPWECCPSVQAVSQIITELSCVTFYDFVLALSRSERVNEEIGVLPERDKLLTAGKSAFFGSPVKPE